MSVSTLPKIEARLKVWFDGALIDADSASTALDSHALHYGSGVFEGIKSYATARSGAVFRLPEHIGRMHRGAELLGLDFDAKTMSEAIITTLRGNDHRNAYIRPLTWAGSGGFGLDTAGHPSHSMVATTESLVHLNGASVRCAVSTRRRNPVAALPTLKLCGGYINSILAKREAYQRGFNEALFVDDEGFVVECTGANVFMVKEGRITAVQHRDALPGITRDTLLKLTGAEARAVTLDELLDADEVFACGTAAEVAIFAALDQREYADAPTAHELAALYTRVVRGEESTHRHWLTEF